MKINSSSNLLYYIINCNRFQPISKKYGYFSFEKIEKANCERISLFTFTQLYGIINQSPIDTGENMAFWGMDLTQSDEFCEIYDEYMDFSIHDSFFAMKSHRKTTAVAQFHFTVNDGKRSLFQYIGRDIVNAPFGKFFRFFLIVNRPAIDYKTFCMQAVNDFLGKRLIIYVHINAVLNQFRNDLIRKSREKELYRLCGTNISDFCDVGINERDKSNVFQIIKAFHNIDNLRNLFIRKIRFQFQNAVFFIFLANADIIFQNADS